MYPHLAVVFSALVGTAWGSLHSSATIEPELGTLPTGLDGYQGLKTAAAAADGTAGFGAEWTLPEQMSSCLTICQAWPLALRRNTRAAP